MDDEKKIDELGEVLTVDEVARFLRMDRRTVYNALDRGELPAKRIGRTWRFSKTKLMAWLSEDPKPVRRRTYALRRAPTPSA